jgi:hypothetical protein
MQVKICSLVMPIKDVLACEAMLARWPAQELMASPVDKSHRTSRPDFFGMSRFSINLKMLRQPAVSQSYWFEFGPGGAAPDNGKLCIQSGPVLHSAANYPIQRRQQVAQGFDW